MARLTTAHDFNLIARIRCIHNYTVIKHGCYFRWEFRTSICTKTCPRCLATALRVVFAVNNNGGDVKFHPILFVLVFGAVSIFGPCPLQVYISFSDFKRSAKERSKATRDTMSYTNLYICGWEPVVSSGKCCVNAHPLQYLRTNPFGSCPPTQDSKRERGQGREERGKQDSSAGSKHASNKTLQINVCALWICHHFITV